MRKWTVFLIAVVVVLCQAVVVEARGKKETPKASAPTTTPAAPAATPAPTPAPTARYIQTDSSISYTYEDKNYMALKGCCYLSCLGVAQSFAKKNLTSAQINSIRISLQQSGALAADTTVLDIIGTINKGFSALGSALRAIYKSETKTYDYIECDATLIRGTTQTGYDHYVEGSSSGETVYNPYPTAYFVEITRVIYLTISGYTN